MAREAPEIRLIRETLEGVLHPSTASTVFFDALQDHGGSLPTTFDEVMGMIRGPLARSLTTRLGKQNAEGVVLQLEQLLSSLAPRPDASGLDASGSRPRPRRKRSSRHEVATKAFMLSEEILAVYVIAGTKGFCDRLYAAVGPETMSALPVADLETLRKRLKQIPAAFVLIDASDFPAIEPADLVAALRTVPTDVIRAIWGADLPYGLSLMDSAQKVGLTLTPFDRREGIEPLIDVIRSRRG